MLDAAGGTFEGGKARAANEAIGLLNGLIAIFGAYFVGHWIGARASRLGIVTMALIGSATAVIWIGSDVFYFSPGKRYTDRFGSEALTALAILGRFTGIVLPEASPIAAWAIQKQRGLVAKCLRLAQLKRGRRRVAKRLMNIAAQVRSMLT
jgi:hypothetical protein